MATIEFNGTLVLDESAGLQTQTDGDDSSTTEDDDDSDIAVAGLPSDFSTLLFTDLGLSNSFATANGVGESEADFIQVTGDGGTDVIDVSFSATGGGALPVFGSADPSVDSGIDTLDGTSILLFSDDDSGTVATAGLLGKVVLGGYDDGSGNLVIAFALFLQRTDNDGDDNMTDWQVYSVQFEPLDNPVDTDHDDPVTIQNLGITSSETIAFGFAGTPSGQLFMAMYVPSGTAQSDTSVVGIVASADNPPNSGDITDVTNDEKAAGNFSLNTSKGGGPTTHGNTNQSVGQNESLTYSLVVNPNRDFVVDNPDTDDVVEGTATQGELKLESSIQFDEYFDGAPGGFFTLVKIAGGGAGSRTVIDVQTFLNTDDADEGANYDNATGTPTGNTGEAVRDGDETSALITGIRVWKVTVNSDGTSTKVDADPSTPEIDPLFDSAVDTNGHNGIFLANLGTVKVTIAGLPEDSMVEFDLGANGGINSGLWNMLEISKTVPDGNYDVDDPFAEGQTFNVANVGVDATTTTPTALDQVFFEDDGPEATLTKNGAVTVELDETAGLQDGAPPTDDDRAADGETADTNNDDVDGANTLFIEVDPTPGIQAADITVAEFFTAGVAAPLATDGTAFPQYALSGSAIVTPSSDVGTDVVGSVELVLALNLAGFAASVKFEIDGGTFDGDTAIKSDLTTTDGSAIYLVDENGVIVGRLGTEGAGADAGKVTLGAAVLAAGINADGFVATALYATLDNGDDTKHDEEVDLASSVGAVSGVTSYIAAVLTATDEDDDTATASQLIGNQVIFEDDGPEATLTKNGAVTVELDETAGLQDGAPPTDDDRAADGETADPDNDDVAAATVFKVVDGTANDITVEEFFDAAVLNQAADGTNQPQYALSGSAIVTPSSDVGEDEEGATVALVLALNLAGFAASVKFEIDGGTFDGDTAIKSDLTTTDGSAIYLVDENGVIVGRLGTEGTGADAGKVTLGAAVLAAGINADGFVATALYATLDNGDDTKHDEEVDLASDVGAVSGVTSYIAAELTVTDGDDDTATASQLIGSQVLFADDGPLLGDPEAGDGGTIPATPDADDPLVALAAGAMFTSANFTWDPGEDEEGADLQIVDFSDPALAFPEEWTDVFGTITAELTETVGTGTDTLVYKDGDDNPLITFELTDNGDGTAFWKVTVNQDAPILLNEIDLSALDPGAPVDVFEFPALIGTNSLTANGLLWFSGAVTAFEAAIATPNATNKGLVEDEKDDRPDIGGTPAEVNAQKQDNVNADQNGLGIFADQSALINPFEGFELILDELVDGFQFVINQNGNAEMVTMYAMVENVNAGTFEFGIIEDLPLTGGGQASVDNLTIVTDELLGEFDWDGDGTIEGAGEAGVIVLSTLEEFDKVSLLFLYSEENQQNVIVDDPDGAARIKRAFIVEQAFLPDVALTVDIQGEDGDGDLTQTETIDFAIDGNGDDLFTI